MKRYEVIEKIINDNGFKRIAEIGVRDGETSKHLLSKCSIDTFLLVDVKKLVDLPEPCHFLEMTSEQASIRVPNNSLDLVFIDADHSYESVKKDIECWLPKVKSGGFITGHDYCNSAHRDVEKAVDEFFGKDRVSFYEDCYVWAVRV